MKYSLEPVIDSTPRPARRAEASEAGSDALASGFAVAVELTAAGVPGAARPVKGCGPTRADRLRGPREIGRYSRVVSTSVASHGVATARALERRTFRRGPRG